MSSLHRVEGLTDTGSPCHPGTAVLDGKMLVSLGFSCVGAQYLEPSTVTQVPSLDRFNRIVVKVGSSLLVDSSRGSVKQGWLEALVADVAALHRRGASVLIVSSGAIALGRTIAGLKG